MLDKEVKTPFFARYLEGQTYPRVKSDLRGGAGKPGFPVVTMKYPSDNDDNPVVITMKYPSDQEG